MQTPLLDVENLRISFATAKEPIEAVRGVSFRLDREKLGIVGESGSGKSQTARAILGLIRAPGRVTAAREPALRAAPPPAGGAGTGAPWPTAPASGRRCGPKSSLGPTGCAACFSNGTTP